MNTRIQYTTDEDRQLAIDQNTDKYLIEDQRLFSGNFLVFSDIPRPMSPEVAQQEIDNLKQEQALMKQAIDDLILGGGF